MGLVRVTASNNDAANGLNNPDSHVLLPKTLREEMWHVKVKLLDLEFVPCFFDVISASAGVSGYIDKYIKVQNSIFSYFFNSLV